MLKKVIKYIIWIAAVCFIGYNSIFIKKLSDVKAAEEKPFDATQYARDYLYKKLPTKYSQAPDIGILFEKLKNDPLNTFKSNSHSPNNGEMGYFLISGNAAVDKINESDLLVTCSGGHEVKLITEFIFGNTVRDAAGLISINEFSNSMDFNMVSEEINELVKEEVIAPFKTRVKIGDKIQFMGCLELNKSDLNLDEIEIIPVVLTINN